jgi:hypothetical protein
MMLENIGLYINVTLGVLLIVSEALPFIKSKDYNGLLHFMAKKVQGRQTQ